MHQIAKSSWFKSQIPPTATGWFWQCGPVMNLPKDFFSQLGYVLWTQWTTCGLVDVGVEKFSSEKLVISSLNPQDPGAYPGGMHRMECIPTPPQPERLVMRKDEANNGGGVGQPKMCTPLQNPSYAPDKTYHLFRSHRFFSLLCHSTRSMPSFHSFFTLKTVILLLLRPWQVFLCCCPAQRSERSFGGK